MEQFFNFFFSQGVLGVVAFGEFFIIWFLYRENKDVNDKRLKDVITSRDALTSPLQKLQETADRITAKMEQSNELLIKLLPNSTK